MKRAGATWAERGKEERKRKKEREGSWAGLKNRVRKEKVLQNSENNSNTSIQIRIQEFKFEPNNKQ